MRAMKEMKCGYGGYPEGQPINDPHRMRWDDLPRTEETPAMVITVDPEGTVTALKRDEFSLGFLGEEEVGRASTIDWNVSTQSWGINLQGEYAKVDPKPSWPFPSADDNRSLTYEECVGFTSYEVARKAEVAWIEHCHERGIQPLSAEGLAFLASYRKNVG